MTKQRSLVLDIVRGRGGHPSAEEVYFAAKQKMPTIAMGTVYNNLNALTEKGEIQRVKVPGAADRFDGGKTPHDHMICESCGQMWDISMPDLEVSLRDRLRIDVLSYDLLVHYTCDRCKRSGKLN